MSRLAEIARRRSRDEDGVILVLLAVGLVVFLGVAAVAIDLGVAYASSRQMQNAADAAALAGAQELECLKFAAAMTTDTVGCQVFPATAAAVARVVTSTAANNGADTSQVTCEVISGYIPGTTPDYQVLGPCATTSSWTPYLNSADAAGQRADGVYVQTGMTEHAFFGGSTGVRNLTQQRQAAATVQSLAAGGAPLLACAYNQTDQKSGQPAPDLLVPSSASPSGYVDNPAALYKAAAQAPQYLLHGPHVANCNLSSQGWKGLADESQPWSALPSLLPILTGVKAGPVRTELANEPGCSSLNGNPGCVLVLPVCTNSNGGSGKNGSLYCVGYGAFELLSSSSNSQTFGFLGLANASSGVTDQGNPDPNGVNVVTLIQ